mgnify:CR=1 FL=1
MDKNIFEYIDKYIKKYHNYQTYWNYEDGCILMGLTQLYDVTGEKSYMDYIIKYLEPLIENDGTINNYETGKHNIDGFNCGKILFKAYDYSHDEKIRLAINFLMKNLMEQPRTNDGNFWHKGIYPNQVWLDGLYMAQPFYMEYETKYNKKENYHDITNQFLNVRKHMYNKEKGLYYHGYDESKKMFWANKDTGLSKNFWLRSMGWYLMALVDTIDEMSDEIYEDYRALCDLFREAIKGILKYRDDETGLFRQVIDAGNIHGNYTETSGTSMVAYAIMKGTRLGILNEEKYKDLGIDIFNRLAKSKLINGELIDICKVAGLGPETSPQRDGTLEYYLSEPITSDDAKGVGPFIMAFAQKLRLT